MNGAKGSSEKKIEKDLLKYVKNGNIKAFRGESMEPIHIAISHRDPVYAKAFAEELADRWRRAAVRVANSEGADSPADTEYVIFDSGQLADRYGKRGIHLYDDPEDAKAGYPAISRFQPMRTIVAEIREYCIGTGREPYRCGAFSDTLFWGFTSGIGGSGTSSLAVATARVLGRLFGEKVLLIGFDRFAGSEYHFLPGSASVNRMLYRAACGEVLSPDVLENCLEKDAYDVRRVGIPDRENALCFAAEQELYKLFSHIASDGGFDHVLLDIPSGISCWKNLMRLCERQIVNFGFRPNRFRPSERLREVLRECCEADGADPDVRIASFYPMEDQDSFRSDPRGNDVDIHGQFGAEVRGLVERMENR